MQINLTPDWSLVAIMAIFIANYFVVRRFFFKPINDLLLERERDVRSAAAVHEEAMSRFHEATSEMEARVQESRRKAAAIREGHRAEAATVRNQLLEQTRGEAEGSIAAAEAELKSSVSTARERIVREADQLARLAAEKILGRTVA